MLTLLLNLTFLAPCLLFNGYCTCFYDMLFTSLIFEDILGQIYAIYIIAIAGAESAIGLVILVAFFRLSVVIGFT